MIIKNERIRNNSCINVVGYDYIGVNLEIENKFHFFK